MSTLLPFIHSTMFVEHLLCARHVLALLLHQVNKARKIPCPHKAYILVVAGSGKRETENTQWTIKR